MCAPEVLENDLVFAGLERLDGEGRYSTLDTVNGHGSAGGVADNLKPPGFDDRRARRTIGRPPDMMNRLTALGDIRGDVLRLAFVAHGDRIVTGSKIDRERRQTSKCPVDFDRGTRRLTLDTKGSGGWRE